MVASFDGACTSSEFLLLPLFLETAVLCQLLFVISLHIYIFIELKYIYIPPQEWRNKGWVKKVMWLKNKVRVHFSNNKSENEKRKHILQPACFIQLQDLFTQHRFEFMTLDLCLLVNGCASWRLMIKIV